MPEHLKPLPPQFREPASNLAGDAVPFTLEMREEGDSEAGNRYYIEELATLLFNRFCEEEGLDEGTQKARRFRHTAQIYFQDQGLNPFLPSRRARHKRINQEALTARIHANLEMLYHFLCEFFKRYDDYFDETFEHADSFTQIETERGMVYQAVVQTLGAHPKTDRHVVVEARGARRPTAHRIFPAAHRLSNRIIDISTARGELDIKLETVTGSIADTLQQIFVQYVRTATDKDIEAFREIALLYLAHEERTETSGLGAFIPPTMTRKNDLASIAYLSQNLVLLFRRLMKAFNDFQYYLRNIYTPTAKPKNPDAELAAVHDQLRQRLSGMESELRRLGLVRHRAFNVIPARGNPWPLWGSRAQQRNQWAAESY